MLDKLLYFKNEKNEINNYQRGLSPQKYSNYDSRSYLTLFMFPSFDHSGELELRRRRRNIAPPASHPPIKLIKTNRKLLMNNGPINWN